MQSNPRSPTSPGWAIYDGGITPVSSKCRRIAIQDQAEMLMAEVIEPVTVAPPNQTNASQPENTHMATVLQVREAMHAAPFRPFTVHLVDGRSYLVRHPDFISIPTSDRGRDLTIHDDDGPHLLDLALVVEIHPLPVVAPNPGNGPQQPGQAPNPGP